MPGVSAGEANVPGKKCASVAAAKPHKDRNDLPEFRDRPRRNLSETIADAVLPRPSVPGTRSKLAGRVLADMSLLAVSFLAVSHFTALLRFATTHAAALQLDPSPISSPGGLLLLYGILFSLLGHSDRLYHAETVQHPGQERVVLAKAIVWSTALIAVAAAWSKVELIRLTTLAATALLSFFAMLAWRYEFRLLARLYASQRASRRVLIVGANKIGRRVAVQLSQGQIGRHKVLGFVDETEPLGGEIRGRVKDLPLLIRTEFVDEVILTAPHQRDVAHRVIWEARRTRTKVTVIPDLFGFEADSIAFEQFGNVPAITLHAEPNPAPGLFLKRGIDIIASTAGLMMATPLLAIVAVVIKLDSPGPVLYRAPRVGFKGRRFTCYKFRTMVANADNLKQQLRLCNERTGAFFKMARITRIGRFLRRYSLDELPQLWNVLRGDMSLVGPRPHPLDDFERYRSDDLRRLRALPGLTGLWQVTARRDPSFERNVELDLEYIERWNLWTDLWILWKTVAVVLQGSGA